MPWNEQRNLKAVVAEHNRARNVRRVICTWLVGAAALTPVSAWGADESNGAGLAQVWAWSVAQEPGYGIQAAYRLAEEAESRALQRKQFPVFSIGAGGDYGQRARPGEERAQGVAGRGDILAWLNWNLLDSTRSARERAVALRQAGAVEAEAAYDLSFRASVAQAYVEAAIAVERYAVLEKHHGAFGEIEKLAQLRIDEGVESGASRDWLEAAEAIQTTLLEQALDDRDQQLMKLALVTGREVVPIPVRLERSSFGIAGEGSQWKKAPSVVALERQAEAILSDADALQAEGGWRLDAFGAAGPYFSQAFDRNPEQEYYAGLRLVWSPDMAGVQRARAMAERQRARALQAEARSQARALEQRKREIEQRADLFQARSAELREAVRRAERAEHGSRLRWNEGLGSWRALLDQQQSTVDARLEELEWRAASARQIVEYAEISNRLAELPQWLGQEDS